MTTVAPLLGGDFKVVHEEYFDQLTNGYTTQFNADGREWSLLRFKLSFVGQSLAIYLAPLTLMYGAINRSKHDGAGSYLAPQGSINTYYFFADRGTGFLEGYMYPQFYSMGGGNLPGWIVNFTGYTALNQAAGGWLNAGGDYWDLDGRFLVRKNGSPADDWNFNFGFGSYAGETGAASFLVEGRPA